LAVDDISGYLKNFHPVRHLIYCAQNFVQNSNNNKTRRQQNMVYNQSPFWMDCMQARNFPCQIRPKMVFMTYKAKPG
jgi:hypothetical protein